MPWYVLIRTNEWSRAALFQTTRSTPSFIAQPAVIILLRRRGEATDLAAERHEYRIISGALRWCMRAVGPDASGVRRLRIIGPTRMALLPGDLRASCATRPGSACCFHECGNSRSVWINTLLRSSRRQPRGNRIYQRGGKANNARKLVR
jgi:hypothetical protein